MEFLSRYYSQSVRGGVGEDGSADDAGGRTADRLSPNAAHPPPSHRPPSSSSSGQNGPSDHSAADEGENGNDHHESPDQKQFDPFERYQEVEEELFRLKFEMAHMMEEEDGMALKERRDRKEIERLRDKLQQIRVEIRGRRVEAEGDGDTEEEKDEIGEKDTFDEEEPKTPSSLTSGENGRGFFEEEGLRLRRDKMDTNLRRLKRDVDLLRDDVESVRSAAERVESDLDTAQQEHDRVLDHYNEMEREGEGMSNMVGSLQLSARQAVRNRVEATLEKEKADDATAQLRGKCEALKVELAQLQEQVKAGGEDARNFRADSERSRKLNERMKDKVLMTTNPEEYRKRKAEERRNKKLEGKRAAFGGGAGRKDGAGNWLSRSVRNVGRNTAGDLMGHSPRFHENSVNTSEAVGKENFKYDEDDDDDDDDGASVATGRYTVA
mmetsp:Transcript_62989/g.186038  ORF Transcript_62989/g.186038 Transcript_62989/m.186038 type:complete len:438 (-) Transcript_62989:287-1600(-)